MVSCVWQCTLASGRISSPNDAFPLGDLAEKRYSKRGNCAKRGVRVIWFSPPVPMRLSCQIKWSRADLRLWAISPTRIPARRRGIFRYGCCRPEYKARPVARCFTRLLGSRLPKIWFARLTRPSVRMPHWVLKIRREAAMHAGPYERANYFCTVSTRDSHRYSLLSSTPKRFPSFGYKVR